MTLPEQVVAGLNKRLGRDIYTTVEGDMVIADEIGKEFSVERFHGR